MEAMPSSPELVAAEAKLQAAVEQATWEESPEEKLQKSKTAAAARMGRQPPSLTSRSPSSSPSKSASWWPPWGQGGSVWSSRVETPPLAKPSKVVASQLDRSDEALERQFASVDTDGSGAISEEELRVVIAKVYGQTLDDEMVKGMMLAADTNQDGQLSLDEFKAIIKAGPAEMANTLSRSSAASAKAIERARLEEEARLEAAAEERRRREEEADECRQRAAAIFDSRAAGRAASPEYVAMPNLATWIGTSGRDVSPTREAAQHVLVLQEQNAPLSTKCYKWSSDAAAQVAEKMLDEITKAQTAEGAPTIQVIMPPTTPLVGGATFSAAPTLKEAVERCIKPHREAFEKCISPHREAFEKCIGPHREAFEKCISPHREAFAQWISPHREAFEQCISPHRESLTKCVELVRVEAQKRFNKKSAQLVDQEEFVYNEQFKAWMPKGANPEDWAKENLAAPPPPAPPTAGGKSLL